MQHEHQSISDSVVKPEGEEMKLFEMEGFLRGKCLPGDMKVNETNAEYLVRKFTDLEQKLAESKREFRAADATIENMQMQVEKLAAELSAIDAIHSEAVLITDEHYEQCPPEVQKMIRSLAVLQIPSYQAFLAEVRAIAVDEVCLKISNAIVNCYQDELIGLDEAATICGDFASELRKGVQS